MRHDRIIDLFGGNTALAGLVDRHHTAISRWRTNGIPPSYWLLLAKLAAERGFGRDVTIEELSAGLPRDSRYRIRSTSRSSVG